MALGNIALQSSLGQPLRAVIPIALSQGETLNTACLKLMRDAVGGTPQLLTGRVSVERNTANARLIVTTPRAVNEPALRVSVQAGCADTTRRDYVLLLDPQGTESSAVVASADLDDFKSYAAAGSPAPLAAPARRPQQVAAARAPTPAPRPSDAAPAPTEFKPIETPAPVAAVQTKTPVPSVPIAAASPSQREPVVLTAAQPRSGFITEAAAASFSRVSTEGFHTNKASSPAALLGTRRNAAEATLWTQPWPYAAVLLSIGAIALTAFVKRRRNVVPTWGDPQVTSFSNSFMQSNNDTNTFAHFGVMTEPGAITPREPAKPTEATESPRDTSLDTLLQEAEADGIDEHTIRKAWATLATESAVDIGTDSILMAIAAAERDMRVTPRVPVQAAIDQSLDDELMREPKPRRS